MTQLPVGLEADAERLAEDWRARCRRDTALTGHGDPPLASAVITAVAGALQPGVSPAELDLVLGAFMSSAGSAEVAVGQLMCLGQTLAGWARRRAVRARAQEVVDRAIRMVVRRVEQEVFLDPLTGLLNRRALNRDLPVEIGRAARHARPLAVVVLDVDGLKRVNDVRGHAAGDALLGRLARALEGALRIGDAAYRVGGDEFVLLLPDTGTDQLRAVMARVSAAAPAFSWGAACFPDDGGDGAALIEHADRRLLDGRGAHRHRTIVLD